MTSLSELHEHARISYRCWPLWLALRRKQIEALLGDVPSNPALDLLHTLNLPLPDDGENVPPLEPITLDGSDFLFGIHTAEMMAVLHLEHQSPGGERQRCDLLRVNARDAGYIERAAAMFNQALHSHPAETVVNTARLWIAMHTQKPPDMIWQLRETAVKSTWD